MANINPILLRQKVFTSLNEWMERLMLPFIVAGGQVHSGAGLVVDLVTLPGGTRVCVHVHSVHSVYTCTQCTQCIQCTQCTQYTQSTQWVQLQW